MKKLLLQILRHLAILVLTGMLCAHGMADTILVFGDSLSAGYGLQAKEDWPHLLQQRLKSEKFGHYKVVNASISGETTSGGLDRFSKAFGKHNPEIVILELGANDGLRGQSLKAMHKNLGTMIRYSLDHKARVILAGMRIPPNYGSRYTDAFHQIFYQLQDEYAIELIPFLLVDLVDNNELIQNDGLHPTARAQPVILDLVWKSLKPLLQIRRETVNLDTKTSPVPIQINNNSNTNKRGYP